MELVTVVLNVARLLAVGAGLTVASIISLLLVAATNLATEVGPMRDLCTVGATCAVCIVQDPAFFTGTAV